MASSSVEYRYRARLNTRNLTTTAFPAHQSGEHMIAAKAEWSTLYGGDAGYCAKTSFFEGDCHATTDRKGSWSSGRLDMCITLCMMCWSCSFVSFSPIDSDCSWFKSCNSLQRTSSAKVTHRTWRVRQVDGSFTSQSRHHAHDLLKLTTRRWLTDTELQLGKQWMTSVEPALASLVQIGANRHDHTSYANDDPGPEAIEMGWRALLMEPVPATFAKLRQRYASRKGDRRLQLVNAAVCHSCLERSTQMWGLDFDQAHYRGTKHSDPRCAAGTWLSEISSLSREYILGRSYLLRSTRQLCQQCSKMLGHELPDNCLSHVLEDNVRAFDVPCFCLQTQLPLRGLTLLLIDTEGHDAAVIEQFPFETVNVTRVRFEASHLTDQTLYAARSRLIAHGFRWVYLNGQDEIWHRPATGGRHGMP